MLEMYDPPLFLCRICCWVDGLHVPVCTQFAMDMITGVPESTLGHDFSLPFVVPDLIMTCLFLVDLSLIDHLHDLRIVDEA